MDGVRPKRPEEARCLGFSDELWRIIELCWLEDRKARPRIEDILTSLRVSVAQGINTRLQKHGKILLQITSLFRFLREPEPEIERLVNEMNEAGHSIFLPSQG